MLTKIKNNMIIIVLIVIVFFICALYIATISPYWKIMPDSAVYVLSARSLSMGEGYKIDGKPVAIFPPVTSLIFSIFILLFPNNYVPLNSASTLFILISLYMFFILFKEKIGAVKSLMVVLLSSGSVFLFQQSTLLLSEPFYMFFSILTLAMAENTIKDNSRLSYFLLGAVALIACMTRIAGLALVPAIIVYFLIITPRKDVKSGIMITAIVLMVIAAVSLWEYRSSLLGGSYLQLFFQNEVWVEESGVISLPGLAKRFLANLLNKYGDIGVILTNGIFKNIVLIYRFLYLSALSLFSLGLTVSVIKRLTAVNIYIVTYLFFMALSPGINVIRYSMPILPFLFYFMLVGLEYIIEKVRILARPIMIKAVYLVIGVYIFCYLGYAAIFMVKNIPAEHHSPFGAYPVKYSSNYDIQRLAMWLKDNSDPGDACISRYPRIINIFAKRKIYYFPFSRDPGKLFKLIKEEQIKYVLVDKTDEKVRAFLLQAIKDYPGRFKLVKDETSASLYEFEG